MNTDRLPSQMMRGLITGSPVLGLRTGRPAPDPYLGVPAPTMTVIEFGPCPGFSIECTGRGAATVDPFRLYRPNDTKPFGTTVMCSTCHRLREDVCVSLGWAPERAWSL